MVGAVLACIACLVVGYFAGKFVTSAKLDAIKKELGSVEMYVSSESRALVTKLRSLL